MGKPSVDQGDRPEQSSHRAPSRPVRTQRQEERLYRRLIEQLGHALEDPELKPEQLSKLAVAFSLQQQAFARSQIQWLEINKQQARLMHERKARIHRRDLFGPDIPDGLAKALDGMWMLSMFNQARGKTVDKESGQQ